MTTGIDECRHGLEKDWCAECTPPAAVPSDAGTVFIASFDSECHGCLRDILAGDQATAKDDGYFCDDCEPITPPDPDDPFS